MRWTNKSGFWSSFRQQSGYPAWQTYKKRTGKSPCLMGKSTISMAIFNIKLLNYQRVYYMVNCSPFTVPGVFSPKRLRYTFWAALLLFFFGPSVTWTNLWGWLPSGNFLHSYWKWPWKYLIFPLKKMWFSIVFCTYVCQRVVGCLVGDISNQPTNQPSLWQCSPFHDQKRPCGLNPKRQGLSVEKTSRGARFLIDSQSHQKMVSPW